MQTTIYIKYVLCCVVVIFSNFVKAQQVPITGLGEFKLGVTTAKDIKTIAIKQGREFFKINAYYAETNFKNKLLEITGKENSCPSEEISCHNLNYNILILPNYTILGKYKCRELKLYLLNDTLYRISVGEPTYSLHDDLKIKYGQPDIHVSKNSTKCSIGQSDFTLQDESTIEYWTDDDKQLNWTVIISYNANDCEKYYALFCEIKSNRIDNRVKQIIRSARQLCESNRDDNKRVQLKDL